MRHVGLLAFGITTAVLVPAAIRHLDAGPQQVARLVAPAASSLELNGAKIEVSADHALVNAGDSVKVKLHGTVPAGKAVTVEVLVLESTSSPESRVANPPRGLERTSVTLTSAAPDKEVAFKLPGNGRTEFNGASTFGQYTILVMDPVAMDRLESLRSRAKGTNSMEDTTGKYEAWSSAFWRVGKTAQPAEPGEEPSEDEVKEAAAMAKIIGKPGASARLDVQTRPIGARIAIAAPEQAKVDEKFAVTVTVKNPTNKKVESLDVSLSTPAYRLTNDTYKGIASESVAIDEESIKIDLGAKESKSVTFHVSASVAGTLGLYATSSCEGDEDVCRKIVDAQVEAVDIVGTKTETAPTITASK